MSMQIHSCIFLVLALGRIAASDSCPTKENLHLSCTCKNVKDDAYVTCNNLQNSEELKQAIQGLKGHKIYSLEVKQSNLENVPGDLFKGHNIEVLAFDFAKMISLGDEKNPPFSGLEHSLKRLSITEGFWDYQKPLQKPIKLDHLAKLTHLILVNNIIDKIGDDWFQDGPKNLQHLTISMAKIKEVGPKAFSALSNLRLFHFTGNALTMSRSALPQNPRYLSSLDLSDNQIQELPSDIFKDMPVLKYIYVDNNGIRSIPQGTWKQILGQAEFVFFHSNPLECDSKMKWIVEAKLNTKIVGECASPKALSGREIESLTVGDLSE